MFKILQLLLTTVLVFSYSDGVIETIETMSLNQNITTQQRSFYKNIAEKFYDYDADVTKKALSTKEKNGESYTTAPGYILNWTKYADSWEEFKANYGNLNLSINLEIAFNWYNVVWTNDSGLSIPLNNITANKDNWIEIINYKKMHEEAIGYFNFMTYAKISYAISVDDIYVKIRFKLETKRGVPTLSYPFVDYDNYYFTIDTRYVRCNSTFDYNSIYVLLNENVNNKTLSLESDTSTSLLDKNNIPIAKLALDQLIERALESHYQQWKNFISDYTYSDISNQAIITIKFDDPNTNESIRWDFKVTIKFNLSQDYWNKNFKERLKIFPGKVIDPNNPNGALIEDKPFLWEDKNVYSTTAIIRFDGAKDGSETMKVNGIPIQVIDNTFTYKMTDNQEKDSEGKPSNEYEVLIEKHDLNDFNKIISSFKFKYLIKQNVPNLDLKWYAWDPEKNRDQKKLIEPYLPNGKPNLNYDREVNSKTGTKTQIIWVKHKAQNPFPLDPLNRNGDIIKNNDYEEGFIAEGSVSGMGITQNFKDSWIKSVQRREVNPKTLQPIGNLETIKADNKGSYFSLSGTYLYIITDQKGHTANKFITIGQQWQEKYAKFLDVLNNPDIAMPFWSTIHGLHLKNYLVKYKYLNSTNIQNLTFEQVVSYWKEYVSDIKSQRVGPDDKPKNNFNLSEIKFETIKMNKSSVDEIKKEIINQIQEQLNRTDLIYDVDYELKPFDDASLKKLLLYDNKGSATINITIIALDISTRLIGTNTIKIINNINYDSTKVIDLKKIKFETQIFYFNNFTVNKLIEWILLDIKQTFAYYKINLNYPYDYGVKPFDRTVLQQFLTSTKSVRLVFTIYAQDSSLKTKNSTTLELVNDPNASVAPDKPPKLKPDPIIPNPSNKGKSWFSKKSNLFFMSIIAIFIIIILGTFFLFKYRFKRGIGFKKNKKNKIFKK